MAIISQNKEYYRVVILDFVVCTSDTELCHWQTSRHPGMVDDKWYVYRCGYIIRDQLIVADSLEFRTYLWI